MNKRFLVGILFILWASILFAQSESMQVSLVQTSPSDSPEMLVTVNINSTIQSGFYLQWPNKMRAVLKSVKLNGQDLWLKHAEGVPNLDKVIYWQSDSNGIYLSVRSGVLNAGDQLVLQFMPSNIQAISDSAIVELKSIINTNAQIKAPGQSLMSRNIIKSVSE